MFIEKIKSGKNVSVLLRDSYREGKKVLHRTIANLTGRPQEEVDAIAFALKNKKALAQAKERVAAPGSPDIGEVIAQRQGKSAGAVWTVVQIARELGIADALGDTRQGRLALWQVVARVIDQGSRLSAVRFAQGRAACETLGLGGFTEDSLYGNLKWVSESQARVEDALLGHLWPKGPPALYLYDVTSCYFEGEENFFASWGYNRDGKKGKRQMVVGLLCDPLGRPLSVEVFPGNTNDTKTVASQIDKISSRFGGREIVFVGDRGMVKSQQVLDLNGKHFKYITGLTRPQIETLIKEGTIEMSLFDQNLAEVEEADEGGKIVRYILRCNPVRAEEVARNRDARISSVSKAAAKETQYLGEHPKANPANALNRVASKAKKLGVAGLAAISAQGRTIAFERNEEAVSKESELDGRYVLKTDVDKSSASKEIIHDRYKDLAKVEWAFRTSKTYQLEMRPVHVRCEKSTRGHVFIVMLAYRVIQELARRWAEIDQTVEEALDSLDSLCLAELHIVGVPVSQRFPEPRDDVRRPLDAAAITLPAFLPISNAVVSTRKKLVERRNLRQKWKGDTHE